jgi:dTDP-4-amino-4,6-dideoxyglucose
VKNSLGDLALLGGEPEFDDPIYVGRPTNINREDLFRRLGLALDRQWLTNDGPLCRALEERIADLVSVKHCVAVSSGTVGLQLVIRALGLTGEIIMPSMTFIATAHAARWLGLDPRFCDIDPVTRQIDPDLIGVLVTPRTSAVLGVHLWGRVCDTDRIGAVSETHGLPVFYDAAHAIGCTRSGRPAGGAGAAEVFSLHATKVVGAFEGGAVTTNDDGLAELLRGLRTFGGGGSSPWGGTNAKMSEASAAMGLCSLDVLKKSVEDNQSNLDAYRTYLADIPGLLPPPDLPGEAGNHQYAVVEVFAEETGVDRDLLWQVLLAENIVAKPYFSPPCHLHAPYVAQRPVRLPHTEALAARTLALPTGSAVGTREVRRICSVIRLALSRGRALAERHRSAVSNHRKGPRP